MSALPRRREISAVQQPTPKRPLRASTEVAKGFRILQNSQAVKSMKPKAHFIRIVLLALVIMHPSSAFAQFSRSPVEAIGDGWTVWSVANPNIGVENCYISKQSMSGTTIEFMFSLTRAELQLSFFNTAWKSLNNGDVQRIELQFSPTDIAMNMDFETINVTELNRGIFRKIPNEYTRSLFKTFLEQDNLSVFRQASDGRRLPMADFDLTGVQNAVATLDNCVRIRKEALERSEAADPFRD